MTEAIRFSPVSSPRGPHAPEEPFDFPFDFDVADPLGESAFGDVLGGAAPVPASASPEPPRTPLLTPLGSAPLLGLSSPGAVSLPVPLSVMRSTGVVGLGSRASMPPLKLPLPARASGAGLSSPVGQGSMRAPVTPTAMRGTSLHALPLPSLMAYSAMTPRGGGATMALGTYGPVKATRALFTSSRTSTLSPAPAAPYSPYDRPPQRAPPTALFLTKQMANAQATGVLRSAFHEVTHPEGAPCTAGCYLCRPPAQYSAADKAVAELLERAGAPEHTSLLMTHPQGIDGYTDAVHALLEAERVRAFNYQTQLAEYMLGLQRHRRTFQARLLNAPVWMPGRYAGGPLPSTAIPAWALNSTPFM